MSESHKIKRIFLMLPVWICTSLAIAVARGDHFRFGSVFTLKNNQNKILKNWKIWTGTEPESVQTDRFRFGLVRFF